MKRAVSPEEMVTGRLPVPGGRFGILVDEQLGGSKGFSLLVNQVDGGRVGGAHQHPEEQCWYILSGTGRITVGGEAYEVSPGMAVYSPPNTPHQVESYPGEPLKYILLYVPAGPEKELREKGERAFGR